MAKMFAAALAMAALAGCAPPPYSSPAVHSPAPAHSPYQPPGTPQADARSGIWSVKCRTDKMTDKRSCDVGADFSYSGRSSADLVVSTFSHSAPSGLTTVVVAPTPLLVRMRVDGAQPITLACSAGICIVPPSFVPQMQRGGTLMVDIQGLRGRYPEPQTFSLSGFDEMRKAAIRGAAGQPIASVGQGGSDYEARYEQWLRRFRECDALYGNAERGGARSRCAGNPPTNTIDPS